MVIVFHTWRISLRWQCELLKQFFNVQHRFYSHTFHSTFYITKLLDKNVLNVFCHTHYRLCANKSFLNWKYISIVRYRYLRAHICSLELFLLSFHGNWCIIILESNWCSISDCFTPMSISTKPNIIKVCSVYPLRIRCLSDHH